MIEIGLIGSFKKPMFQKLSILICTSVLLLSLPLHGEWEDFKNSSGVRITAKIVEVYDDSVMIMRKKDRRKFTIKIESLDEASQEIVRSWKGGDEESDEVGDDGGLNGKLYPKDKSEIKATVREIEKREPSSDKISKDQQKVINELNVYRYLCGVPYDVVGSPKMIDEATQAALACEKNGGLSHNIGSFTDKCNLSSSPNIFETVKGYIHDFGAHNRAVRGHRRWCFNPPMKETGFGRGKNSCSAMWAMDNGGKKLKDSWAYPGKGLFPHDRLHGEGWSLYLPERAPSADELTVEVYRLKSRPEKRLLRNDEPEGRKLPVEFVHTYLNTINFEPESSKVKKGIYWVRVTGGGVREGYVVELF